jgi:predicted DsbA family dithiol-disulfide isomerase
LNSLIPIFRGMLRLKTTQAPPIGKEDIINGIAKKFGIDPLAFLRILQDREGRNKIDSKNIETIFQDYIGQIQKLSVLADRI